ncbi:MAG: hypothetical protein V3S56_06265 [Gemmatimonadota bacterium]
MDYETESRAPQDGSTQETAPQVETPVTEPAAEPVAADGAGLDANMAGALAYLLGAITGILFLVIDKRPSVRFHAMQAITVTVGMIGLSIVLGIIAAVISFIPILGWLIGLLLSLGMWAASLVLWLYLMYRAWQGDEWEVPVAGSWARRLTSN